VGQALPLLLRFLRVADLVQLLLDELAARSAASQGRLFEEKDRGNRLHAEIEGLRARLELDAKTLKAAEASLRTLRGENLELSEALNLAAQDFAAAGISLEGAGGALPKVLEETEGERDGSEGGGGAARGSAKKGAQGPNARSGGRVVVVPRAGAAPGAAKAPPPPPLNSPQQREEEGYASAEGDV
jgi:hypothetical protein